MIVNYKLKTNDIWNIETRLTEVQEIVDWVDELVDWDTTQYRMTYHSSAQVITIWFDKDKYAAMFLLRWA